MEEYNPWNPPSKEAKVDVIGIIRHFKDKARAKLRAGFARSRRAYRKALHYKEPEITKAEMYDEIDKMDE